MTAAVLVFLAGMVAPAFAEGESDSGSGITLNANKASRKGNYIVTGGFDGMYKGGNYYAVEDSNGSEKQPWYVLVNPSAEYFVTNGFSVGGTFVYGYYNTPTDGYDMGQRMAFGPKMSFYFNYFQKVIPFISADAMLENFLLYKKSDKSLHWSYNRYSTEGQLGAVFMASDQVGFYAAVTGSFLYQTQEKVDAAADEDKTEKKIGWTSGFQIGVKYFIF